jgi:hypothetical protein
LTIPQYYDAFGDKATIRVTLGETSSFLIWNENKKQLQLIEKSGLKVGNYSVDVVMIDQFGKSQTFKVPIEVAPEDPLDGIPQNLISWKPSLQKSPPIPYIKWIN